MGTVSLSSLTQKGTHADEVFALEPFPNDNFGGMICLTLQLRKHMQGKEEDSSKQGISSRFPALSKKNKQMSQTQRNDQGSTEGLCTDRRQKNLPPLQITAWDACWWEAVATADVHNPTKQLAEFLRATAPKPGSLKAFRNRTKTRLELWILTTAFLHTCSSAKAPTSRCAPRLCVSKGILEPLTCLGENGSNSYKAAFVGLSSQHTTASAAEAMPACNSAVSCII